MENLARGPNSANRADVARKVLCELHRCGIPAIEQAPNGEVPYTHVGKAGAFTFKRAWYYWVVKGPVPLSVALELYAHPVGRTDIRVAGHCACPAPEYPWVEYFGADGRRLMKPLEGDRQVTEERLLDKFEPDWRERVAYVDDPAAVAVRAVVESYHIDSELGLYIFVETLRRHGVLPAREPER